MTSSEHSAEWDALGMYREAQKAQDAGLFLESSILFLISMITERYNTNATYQVCWNLARLGEWELCQRILKILLERTPEHESGNLLLSLVGIVIRRQIEPMHNGFRKIEARHLRLLGTMPHDWLSLRLQGRLYRSPKELRRCIEDVLLELGNRAERKGD